MILVDIYIPAVDESFDFTLDENTVIEKVILEIIEMVSKKMKGGNENSTEDFFLYFMDKEQKLEKTGTLYTSGVIDGSRLMLV